jgi:hypothetical protein
MKMLARLTPLVLLIAVATPAAADVWLDPLPARTRLAFHVDRPLSSDKSASGDRFAFELTEPVRSNATVILPAGAVGSGTVYLAGHAGAAGHEGDLTLRLDSIAAPDGGRFVFADQRFEVNGRNRKVASFALGAVPFVGMASHFVVRGAEVRIDPTTRLETVLERPAAPEPSATP